MQNLIVQIVSFVDDHQHGVVACEFVDVEDRKHTIIDKVPIFTADALDATSTYPQLGSVRCEVLKQWPDTSGRELFRISISRPDHVESTEGLSEFVVVAAQLSSE